MLNRNPWINIYSHLLLFIFSPLSSTLSSETYIYIFNDQISDVLLGAGEGLLVASLPNSEFSNMLINYLKLLMVIVFTPWELVNAIKQGLKKIYSKEQAVKHLSAYHLARKCIIPWIYWKTSEG